MKKILHLKDITKKNKILFYSLIFLSTLLLSNMSISSAWTGPSADPPICPVGAVGCDYLLNTGVIAQTKIGGISLATTSGNVGIGKASPSCKLDVSGIGNFTGVVVVATPTDDTHAATRAYVNSVIGSSWTVSEENIYNSNAGNVGIGTNNPKGLLQIDSSSSDLLKLRVHTELQSVDSLAGIGFGVDTVNQLMKASIAFQRKGSNGQGDLIFSVDSNADTSNVGIGDEKMRIQGSTGNVGIGTVSPGYKLDVNGTARFTGAVIVPAPTENMHASTKKYVDDEILKIPAGGGGSLAVTQRDVASGSTGNASCSAGEICLDVVASDNPSLTYSCLWTTTSATLKARCLKSE